MEQSSFFNAEKTANGTYDRTYNAEDWAAYFATFVGNGVSCTPTTNLQVESSSGMNVLVDSGVAFINGYRYENTTTLTVEVNQANSTYDRITSIILELNLNNRNILCKTIDGTAEPNPQPPTLIRTDSIYQLQLATVYVPAGATSIGAITDTRENTEVCGYMQMLAPTIPPAFLANITLQGTIKNDAIIIGGTYKNSCVEDTGINSCGISDSTLSGSIVNNATVTGGEYENPTLTGKVNINDGLFNNGNPIVNASTVNVSHVHVQDNVTGTINLEYWALNAGLLSANTNNLTCGIIKASITLDSNCTWNNRNPIYLNVEGFPNANAMTVTYQKNFVVGCGQNVIVLNGNNAYLNANETYTEYALIYG